MQTILTVPNKQTNKPETKQFYCFKRNNWREDDKEVESWSSQGVKDTVYTWEFSTICSSSPSSCQKSSDRKHKIKFVPPK